MTTKEPVLGDAGAVSTRINVADAHVTLAAVAPFTVTDAMSFVPKFTPTTVTTKPPLLGPCVGAMFVMDGTMQTEIRKLLLPEMHDFVPGAYVYMFAMVPLVPKSSEDTSILTAALLKLAGVTARMRVADTHVTAGDDSVPNRTNWMSLLPKLEPVIVTVMPPARGPTVGAVLLSDGTAL